MNIPFLNLYKQNSPIKSEIFREFEQVFRKSAFSSGEYVDRFEAEFARFTGGEYCVAVNSGTSAIHLMMIAAEIGPGDEVIVPVNTFIATIWGIIYQGAVPVFVDCNQDTWQIDTAKIEENITGKTKAIVGVCLYGQPYNRQKVKEIADKHDLLLLEDAAQAHGATVENQKLGENTFISGYSFYPGKNLGAPGEAGAIVFNDKKFISLLKSLRNQGSTQKYFHEKIGYNYRMGGLEAAALFVKLKYLPEWNLKRIQIAKRYLNEIDNSLIQFQHQPKNVQSVFHLFVIATENRTKLTNYLLDHGIQIGKHYPVACHLQKSLSYLGYNKGDFPIAEKLSNSILTLPLYPELSNDQIEYIIEKVNSYC
jgi:dTDP-4-amino-4,6-dideoxygalactose transaminase